MLNPKKTGFLQFNTADKLKQASKLFSKEGTFHTHQDLKKLMFTLEKQRAQHIRTTWNILTLEQYLEKKMVPRDLRLKKNPTFPVSEEFTSKWNEILTDCSLKLIQLLIMAENDNGNQS